MATSDTASNQKNLVAHSHSRVKRSLIGDLACSVNATQVHPQSMTAFQTAHRRQSSRDLFTELDHLRSLLQESKEREFKLQAELSEWKRNPRVLELETEVEVKRSEVDELKRRLELLEEEKVSLSEQLSGSERERSEESESSVVSQNLEIEVVELRRLNKELQLQKRNLACRLASVESQLASLAKASEVLLFKYYQPFSYGFCFLRNFT